MHLLFSFVLVFSMGTSFTLLSISIWISHIPSEQDVDAGHCAGWQAPREGWGLPSVPPHKWLWWEIPQEKDVRLVVVQREDGGGSQGRRQVGTELWFAFILRVGKT